MQTLHVHDKSIKVTEMYDANFTAGGLLFYEFNAIKNLLLSDDFNEEIHKEIETNSLIGIATLSSRKRIIAEIKRRYWVETQHKNILTKEAIGRALHYAVNQLPLIEPFFEDGRIHLDNNAIENKIRPLALGRKNFLFAGSHEGAKRIAMMYSFFASCKEADVNPYAWMTDTLNRIGNHPINKISELLPSNFQKL